MVLWMVILGRLAPLASLNHALRKPFRTAFPASAKTPSKGSSNAIWAGGLSSVRCGYCSVACCSFFHGFGVMEEVGIVSHPVMRVRVIMKSRSFCACDAHRHLDCFFRSSAAVFRLFGKFIFIGMVGVGLDG